jgi:iron complex transport system substrate-binding protein
MYACNLRRFWCKDALRKKFTMMGEVLHKEKEAVADIPYLEKNSQLNVLNAVKNKRVYVAPAGTFTWNGAVETPLMLEWAATKFYPDLFKQSDLIKDIESFYQQFLGYQLTDQQAEEMTKGLQ